MKYVLGQCLLPAGHENLSFCLCRLVYHMVVAAVAGLLDHATPIFSIFAIVHKSHASHVQQCVGLYTTINLHSFGTLEPVLQYTA
jgi:hypothetical protein